jgi:hypothetical protein
MTNLAAKIFKDRLIDAEYENYLLRMEIRFLKTELKIIQDKLIVSKGLKNDKGKDNEQTISTRNQTTDKSD